MRCSVQEIGYVLDLGRCPIIIAKRSCLRNLQFSCLEKEIKMSSGALLKQKLTRKHPLMAVADDKFCGIFFFVFVENKCRY